MRHLTRRGGMRLRNPFEVKTPGPRRFPFAIRRVQPPETRTIIELSRFTSKATTGVRRKRGAKFMHKKFRLVLGAVALIAAVPLLMVHVASREFGAKTGWQAGVLTLLLPLAGALVFTTLVGAWLTSGLWFISENGFPSP